MLASSNFFILSSEFLRSFKSWLWWACCYSSAKLSNYCLNCTSLSLSYYDKLLISSLSESIAIFFSYLMAAITFCSRSSIRWWREVKLLSMDSELAAKIASVLLTSSLKAPPTFSDMSVLSLPSMPLIVSKEPGFTSYVWIWTRESRMAAIFCCSTRESLGSWPFSFNKVVRWLWRLSRGSTINVSTVGLGILPFSAKLKY